MKRRLDLAMTLVSRPRLIFLDEPTTGLDPRSRRDLWQIVREQLADGVTVFLTTQYLEEADQLAHTVGLLDDGRLVAEGTPGRAEGPGRRRDPRRRVPRPHRPPRHRQPDDEQTHDEQRRARGDPMSTLTYAARDSATMLRRNLKHLLRYPSLTVTIIAMPVVFLLLFVYVFGGTMGAGLPGGGAAPTPGRLPGLHHPGDPGDDGAVGGAEHRDPHRQGRDRGDHRPVPDDADRPLGAAHRPRARRAGADRRSRSWSSLAIAVAARLPQRRRRSPAGSARPAWSC